MALMIERQRKRSSALSRPERDILSLYIIFFVRKMSVARINAMFFGASKSGSENRVNRIKI